MIRQFGQAVREYIWIAHLRSFGSQILLLMIDLKYTAWASGEPIYYESSEFCLNFVGPSFSCGSVWIYMSERHHPES